MKQYPPDQEGVSSRTTVVILAGGLGTRLRPSVVDRPKVLADVDGRPFLAHVLDQVAEAGVEHAVVCTGYLGDHIEAEFGRTYRDVTLSYSREHRPLGTAGAVRAALGQVSTEDLLIVNGDSYCDSALAEFHRWCVRRGFDVALLAVEVPDTSRFGTIGLAGESLVASFVEKQGLAEPGLINAGVYFFKRTVVAELPSTVPLSLEHDVLPRLAPGLLHARRVSGAFIDIGTPESYRTAGAFFTEEVQA